MLLKIGDFERLYDDVEVLEQTDSTVFFTFRTDEEDRLRYSFFDWFEVPRLRRGHAGDVARRPR